MTATIDADMRLLLEWVFENALDEDKSGFLEEREANRVAKYCGYTAKGGRISKAASRCSSSRTLVVARPGRRSST